LNQIDIKMGSKIYLNLERRFCKNRAPAAAGARFLQNIWWNLGTKIDQKSLKQRFKNDTPQQND